MSCQSLPTATQYSTLLTSNYVERTIEITDFVTLTIPDGRKRQDPTPTTNSASLSNGGFNINVITSILGIRTTVVYDLSVVTSLIPQATLFAPCTSDGGTSGGISASRSGDRATNSTVNDDTTNVSPQTTEDFNGKNLDTVTSDGLTIIVSDFVTTMDGHPTTLRTPIQTLLNTSPPLSDGARAGIIAGSSVGGVLILISLLALLFYFRRSREARKRRLAERQKRSSRHLLEDEAEDFDMSTPMGQWDGSSVTASTVNAAPRLLRPRGSRTGSLFHENVWPPPTEVMQDPLLTADDLGSSISLVMGPPAPPVALTTPEAVGIGGGRQPITAYDSFTVRSNDSIDYGRSHSRADSGEPLLDNSRAVTSPYGFSLMSSGFASMSTPTITPRPRDSRGGRSHLSNSYTAEDLAYPHSRVGSSYSTASLGRRVVNASPLGDMSSSVDTDDSRILREVLDAGSRAGTPTADRPRDSPPSYSITRR